MANIDQTGTNLHPSYSAEDASLILTSSDGVSFRVHPVILRVGSEIFSNMLNQATDTGEAVVLEENSNMVKLLLDSIYPNAPCYNLQDLGFNAILSLLEAAKKYGINKIIEDFHLRLNSDSYFTKRPLEAYVIAFRHDWEKERRNATFDAMDHLNKQDSWKLLGNLDHSHALKLQKLAAIRKNSILKMIQDSIDSYYFPEYADPEDCNYTDYKKTCNTLLPFVNMEMDRFPSCRTVMQTSFWVQGQLKELDPNFLDALKNDSYSATNYLPFEVDSVSLEKIYGDNFF